MFKTSRFFIKAENEQVELTGYSAPIAYFSKYYKEGWNHTIEQLLNKPNSGYFLLESAQKSFEKRINAIKKFDGFKNHIFSIIEIQFTIEVKK